MMVRVDGQRRVSGPKGEGVGELSGLSESRERRGV